MESIRKIDGADRHVDPIEQRVMLQKMRSVSTTFYGSAVYTGVHGFIEFCGLMNEFINICEHSGRKGINFSQANTHTGQELHMETFQVEYLAEKLECIYGATIQNSPELTRIFLEKFLPGVAKQLYNQTHDARRDPLAGYVSAHE